MNPTIRADCKSQRARGGTGTQAGTKEATMRKITYEGKVPRGYKDSGRQTSTFYVTNGFEIEAAEIAQHDARMAMDFSFGQVLTDVPFSSKAPFLAMVYTGRSQRWDGYFKKYFDQIDGYCVG